MVGRRNPAYRWFCCRAEGYHKAWWEPCILSAIPDGRKITAQWPLCKSHLYRYDYGYHESRYDAGSIGRSCICTPWFPWSCKKPWNQDWTYQDLRWWSKESSLEKDDRQYHEPESGYHRERRRTGTWRCNPCSSRMRRIRKRRSSSRQAG